MPYRDDATALLARVQALEAEVARLRDAALPRDAAAPPRDPALEVRGPRPAPSFGWMAALVERLPAGEQTLVTDLVTLFVTRRDYPSLDGVSAAALEPLIARLRAALG